MRVILIILMLMICFLAGVLYGTDQQVAGNNEPPTQQANTEVQERMAEEIESIENEEIISVQNVNAPVFKAATALETVVNFFYEIIVGILFQISKLFY